MGPRRGELRGSGGWWQPAWRGLQGWERFYSLYTHTLFYFSYFFLVFQPVLFPGAALGAPEWSSTTAAGAVLGRWSPAPPLHSPRGAHRLEPEIR